MATKRSSDSRRLRIFERALRHKAHRYIPSGLILVGIGLVVISFGLLLNTGGYSPLILGLGAIVVLVGIIRVLIGVIRPTSPEDLSLMEKPKSQQDIDEIIFD